MDSYNVGSGTQTDSAALNRLDRELEKSAKMLGISEESAGGRFFARRKQLLA
jgi:hypothetical protein